MQEASSQPANRPPCPQCGSTRIHIHGVTHSGTPNFRCCDCRRRFVAQPKKGPVPEAKKELVRRLLAERMALRAIARVAKVSRSWLQAFVNEIYQNETPWEPGPLKKKRANSSSKPTNSGVS
jgi:transposase-like protein